MKPNYKKSLKLLTLLATAIIIATASATTYRYMYIEGGVTITSAKLVWQKGSDVSNCNITGSTATLAVNVNQGTPMNFTQALFLKNTNATGSFSYTITVTQALSPSDFQRAKMWIYQNSTGTWAYLAVLDLTSTSSTYSNSLSAGNYLRMTLEFNATASTGTKNFAVQVQYQ
jgi:hypothetical protein